MAFCSKINKKARAKDDVLDLIVNYTAGGKHGKKVKKTLSIVEARLKEKNIKYAVHHTEYKGHGTIITRELIKNGATSIVVLGGDGTLHEVINGFSNFDKVTLGLVPCGTGNDFATALKLPRDPLKAIDLIIDGTPKYTDFMQLLQTAENSKFCRFPGSCEYFSGINIFPNSLVRDQP
ncbi:MAG: acylglycerol kinase family protein, partial [Clostridia bacterium]|nr:acylglycerol kinase family protein [Clostridia bacterium]